MRHIDDVAGEETILLRVDLNSPVSDGVVQDNKRFQRHAETVDALAADDHVVVCLAHQGRPQRPSFLPLSQHADILSEHVGQPVTHIDSTADSDAVDAIRQAEAGDVLLLENVRMHPDELAERSSEQHAESDLVQTLAAAADAYVNDGFSVAHRSHASTVGFPHVLPAAAGPVMLAEYDAAASLHQRSFDGSVVLLCGGVKAGDVLHVMRNVDDVVDTFLVAGVLGELFLRAEGYDVGFPVNGDARYDELWETHQDGIEAFLERRRDSLLLPHDLATEQQGQRVEHDIEAIRPKTDPYYDIGTQTIAQFTQTIDDAAAVFMKGAPGVFEDDMFAKGTVSLLQALADTSAYTVVGGGDTARAIPMHGLDEHAYSHVSIAGGAYIRALTGEGLPAIEALQNTQQNQHSEDL